MENFEIEGYIDELDTLQANMQKKALDKDKSIIMEVFKLEEIINNMKEVVFG